ncbi:MAG TPA: two-component regulator propeller domain-containing protein [Terriglobales bacterium]|jgi:ligand-binding sensor domain-containing protein|nr:two-component regulator propeller domain-containing protein [Terriglobales bacterium]
MRLRLKASWPVAVAAGTSIVIALFVAAAGWRASRALHKAAEEVRSDQEIALTTHPYPGQQEPLFETISAPAVFLQAAQFQRDLYIAGPAGLSRYNFNGTLLKHYAAGQELPSSPLVAIAPAMLSDSRQQELVIATAQDGLLAFNGRDFRQILPRDADARAITSVLPAASGHLLIGTKKRGVLLYDGVKMTALHPSLSRLYVTTLAGSESDLWVGTLDRGVLHWHGGEAEVFAEEQGLPDPQVQSIAITGDRAYVGTVLGVAVFERAHFSRTLAAGVLATALLPGSAQLLVGSEDQGVLAIPFESRRPNSASGGAAELSEVRQLFEMGDAAYALTRSGLYRMRAQNGGWQSVLQPGAAVLSDRNISALAADSQGRLWVGYFDRGLDLLPADRTHVTHVENEHVFCVNRIVPNPKDGTIDVATANGLVRFDSAGHQEQVLTRADGLIADHVTDVAPYRNGLALATPAGLTFLDSSGARSMYAFQGLVNNHVYALGIYGDELMAGTLGGLSQLEKGDVQLNYTTATSDLKHNWITAIVRVGPEWMVGTYGAGVLELDSSGQFHSFETATGQIEINPNAMLATPDHVFAGTLGQGLYVYERESGRWFAIAQGLPSSNVTALAAAGGYLYVGTDNGLVRIPEQRLLRP